MKTEEKRPNQNHVSDEIDLGELWFILKKRKRLLYLSTASTVFLGVVYLFFAPSLFESKASLYLGQFDDKPLEEPVPLVARLDARLGKEYKDRTNAKMWIHKISQNRNDKRLIELVIRAPSPEEARSFAKQISDEVVSEHKARFDELTRNVREESEELKQLLRTGRGALAAASSARTSDGANRLDLWAAIMYSSGELAHMQTRLGELRNILEGSRTSLTGIVEPPLAPKKRAGPKGSVILGLALFVGLIVGVFAALFLEMTSRQCEAA